MKIKEIDRIGNVAWSPLEVDPVYLAVGTAAQQLDSSFSTTSSLELYQFDINQSGLDLPVKATIPCESRYVVIQHFKAQTTKEILITFLYLQIS
jgi:protein transport protein SEC31